MNLNKKFSENKNLLYVILGVLLVIYLYLETPVPINLILNDTLLMVVVICFIIVSYFLITKLNIFVGLLFIIIAFEILRKISFNQNGNFERLKTYTSESNLKSLGHSNLKKAYTLEEKIVNTMNNSNNNNGQMESAEYKPLLPDLSSTSTL